MRSSCAGKSPKISRLALYLSGFIATNSAAGIRSDMMGPIESASLWSSLSTAWRKALPALAASQFIFEPAVRAPRIAIIGAMLGIRSHDHIKEATHVCSYLGAMIPEAGVSE
jgi:hypothetical protein